MTGRILIDIQNVKLIASGDSAMAAEMQRELETLADELNSALPSYEVTLVHLDTDDYLAFTPRDIDTDDDDYFQDMEDRRQIADDLLADVDVCSGCGAQFGPDCAAGKETGDGDLCTSCAATWESEAELEIKEQEMD